MVGSLVHQLTEGVCPEELEKAGLGAYYTDHGVDVYPQSAAGNPWTASYIAAKGDPIANLQEDLAAEQKARATYEKLIDLSKDDPCCCRCTSFLTSKRNCSLSKIWRSTTWSAR